MHVAHHGSCEAGKILQHKLKKIQTIVELEENTDDMIVDTDTH